MGDKCVMRMRMRRGGAIAWGEGMYEEGYADWGMEMTALILHVRDQSTSPMIL